MCDALKTINYTTQGQRKYDKDEHGLCCKLVASESIVPSTFIEIIENPEAFRKKYEKDLNHTSVHCTYTKKTKQLT